MNMQATRLSKEIVELGREPYVLQLETDGLTIVPPEVTGVTDEFLDRCTKVLLDRFEELTGCPITVEGGPQGELDWSSSGFLQEGNQGKQSQALLQQIMQLDRSLRDLCVNPVVDALIDHLMGRLPGAPDKNASRLSSTNSFIKWAGEFGYGPTLGLHGDQGANPLPWGPTALTANATWCLTDYTKDGGALAWVPGSHKSGAHPVQPAAAKAAVPAECPRGSVIIFPGSTWHGAFPKETEGLRLCAVAYYRHHAVLPQENLPVTMRNGPWEDCDNPEMMAELCGFNDTFPYLEQTSPLPRFAS